MIFPLVLARANRIRSRPRHLVLSKAARPLFPCSRIPHSPIEQKIIVFYARLCMSSLALYICNLLQTRLSGIKERPSFNVFRHQAATANGKIIPLMKHVQCRAFFPVCMKAINQRSNRIPFTIDNLTRRAL